VLGWAVKVAMMGEGVEGGDGDYLVKLGLLVPEHPKRKRDAQNCVDLVSDALEGVLGCDDSRFRFETLGTRVVPVGECGVRLVISKYG